MGDYFEQVAGVLLAGIVGVVAGILVVTRVLDYVVAIHLLGSGAVLIVEALWHGCQSFDLGPRRAPSAPQETLGR